MCNHAGSAFTHKVSGLVQGNVNKNQNFGAKRSDQLPFLGLLCSVFTLLPQDIAAAINPI